MFWFIFAFMGALGDAGYYSLIKKYMGSIDQHVLAGGTFLISSIIIFCISFINGIPQIGENFYYAVLASAFVNAIATFLYFKALKITDLSLAVPMLSFSPIFLIGTSFFLLNEFPSNFGIIGILLIVSGSYILNINSKKHGLLEPIKQMFNNKGIFYMLIVAFLFSFGANFDKIAVLNSDFILAGSITQFLIGLSFIAVSLHKSQDTGGIIRKNIKKFLYVASLIVISSIAVCFAYTLQIVPYVISVKRMAILLSVLFGGAFFKENEIGRKMIAALLMLLGILFIILF